MLRIVIDTNVLISGLILPASHCGKIIPKLKNNEFIIVLSKPILEEFIDVIQRPKFNKLITVETIKEIKNVLKLQSLLVKPSKHLAIIKDDPDDNRFLEAAIQAKADCIVSEDNHLLILKNFQNIPILSPKDFLTKFKTDLSALDSLS